MLDYFRAGVHFDRQEFNEYREYFQRFSDWFLKALPNFDRVNIARPYFFGIVAVRQGDIEDARKKLQELNSMLEADLTPLLRESGTSGYIWLETEILLAEGETQKAVAVCEKMQSRDVPSLNTINIGTYNMPFSRDVLARAYQANGDIDKAIIEYEKHITLDPQEKSRHLINPKYYYRLAKLYQQIENKKKAIANYERFLELFKDAVPDYAEVEDAQKQLISLK